MYYDFEFWVLFITFFLGMTYVVLGFVIAFEVTLAMSGSTLAMDWIKKHCSYKELYAEVIVFYPMILLGYLFLEVLPHYLFGVQKVAFDLQDLFDKLYQN
jgi:hypothetical protein